MNAEQAVEILGRYISGLTVENLATKPIFDFTRIQGINVPIARKIGSALRLAVQSLELNFSFDRIVPSAFHELASGIRHLPQLKELGLFGNALGLEGSRELADLLRSLPNLERLNMGNNGIGDAGAREIAEALVFVPKLKTLVLGANEIRDEGAIAIARGLPESIEFLSLNGNKIGRYGAIAIAEKIPDLPNLTRMFFVNNPITPDVEGILKSKFTPPRTTLVSSSVESSLGPLSMPPPIGAPNYFTFDMTANNIASEPAEERDVYYHMGHGSDEYGQNSQYIMDRVPDHNTYVNATVAGVISGMEPIDFILPLGYILDKRFTDPVRYRDRINEIFDDGRKIKIYNPGDTFVRNIFYPLNIQKREGGLFEVGMSGVLSRRRFIEIGGVNKGIPETSSISLDRLQTCFEASVYPTAEDIREYFTRTCADHIDNLVYQDIVNAYHYLKLDVGTIMRRFPGIHYNFMCRNVSDSRLEAPVPPPSPVLRRMNSGRPVKPTLAGIWLKGTFVDFLETCLEYESRGTTFDPTELEQITTQKAQYSDIKGENFKLNLIAHMRTLSHVRDWNPSPEILSNTQLTGMINDARDASDGKFPRSVVLLTALLARREGAANAASGGAGGATTTTTTTTTTRPHRSSRKTRARKNRKNRTKKRRY